MSRATRISLALFAVGVIFGVIFVSYLAGQGQEENNPILRSTASPTVIMTENAATIEALTTLSGSALEGHATEQPPTPE